jgi:5-methylcytosine-specific restriction endonuclease McrA
MRFAPGYPNSLTIDHAVPLCRGGRDEEPNWRACCWDCNRLKGAMSVVQFIRYLERGGSPWRFG